MIKRIIFIIESLFDARKYHQWGIEVLQGNSFQVEVWDLTFVLHPSYANTIENSNIFVFDGYRKFSDRDQMNKQLSSLSNEDFVMNFVSYEYWNLAVYRALSQSKAQYAASVVSTVPIYRVNRMDTFKKRLKCLVACKKPDSKYLVLWKKLFMRIPFQWLGIRPVRLMLLGGDKSFSNRYPVNRKTEFLKIHSYDYDEYLKEKHKDSFGTEPTAVFIDEFIPFSHDLYFENRGMIVDAAKYRALLNHFFDRVEKAIGLKVVIAADPRSKYEEIPDCFNGRKIIKGKTRILVKESRLVLAHRSTAVSFANLYRKSVIFLTCSELDRSLDGRQMREMAKWFGKKPIFMDNHNAMDWDKELKVSQNHYDRYRQSYIKSDGTVDLPLWQIVANRLKAVI